MFQVDNTFKHGAKFPFLPNPVTDQWHRLYYFLTEKFKKI